MTSRKKIEATFVHSFWILFSLLKQDNNQGDIIIHGRGQEDSKLTQLEYYCLCSTPHTICLAVQNNFYRTHNKLNFKGVTYFHILLFASIMN